MTPWVGTCGYGKHSISVKWPHILSVKNYTITPWLQIFVSLPMIHLLAVPTLLITNDFKWNISGSTYILCITVQQSSTAPTLYCYMRNTQETTGMHLISLYTAREYGCRTTNPVYVDDNAESLYLDILPTLSPLVPFKTYMVLICPNRITKRPQKSS